MTSFHSCLAILSLLCTGGCLTITDAIDDQPPSIIEEPTPFHCSESTCDVGDTVTIYFKRQDTIKIHCKASGRPEVTYNWTKDGANFDTSSLRIYLETEEGTVFIKNATQTDQGVYQCSATNDYGTSLSKRANVIFANDRHFNRVSNPKRYSLDEYRQFYLKCNLPDIMPKHKVSWTYENIGDYLTNDNLFDRQKEVQLSERVSMDSKGTLYFANIREIDGGKIYRCNTYNSIYRNVKTGDDHIINVNTRMNPTQIKPQFIHNSETKVVGLKGEQATFTCILYGYPTPEMIWKKNGVEIDDRSGVILKSGHELIIRDLEYEDTGEYSCKGLNIVGSTNAHKFQLLVEARPFWLTKPVDVTTNIGEDAEFPCLVDGIPTPVVKWFINGKPIDEIPNPKRSVMKDRLVFRSVTASDTQVIQCKASNKHGSLMADVYLNVLENNSGNNEEGIQLTSEVFNCYALNCVVDFVTCSKDSTDNIDKCKDIYGLCVSWCSSKSK
ncbi:neural cell adhesion molecule L1-like protein [Mytilus californianus]|uniref:neural cell adhesion molecule L1-like protein n=1 Tax=Mytilus californianus TaxID=6549 RepID=UPI0022476316|nr:neural cell adhesion molecule L1-like protein [Mytilus californianus]